MAFLKLVHPDSGDTVAEENSAMLAGDSTIFNPPLIIQPDIYFAVGFAPDGFHNNVMPLTPQVTFVNQ